jgi:hypothetical protein
MIKRMTKEDYVKVAEELAVKEGGMIPSTKWLIYNGYKSLTECIHHSPESFKHIK